jgi:hypothetical protein
LRQNRVGGRMHGGAQRFASRAASGQIA